MSNAPDSDPLPAEVVQAFGLDPDDAERLTGGRISQLWRVRRDGDAVALRRSPWFRTVDEVRHECDLLTRLRDDGARVAAPVAGPVELVGSTWTAFEWSTGSHPVRPVEDPHGFGRLLGRLHRHTAAVGPDQQRPGWGRLDEFLGTARAGGPLTLGEVLTDFERDTGSIGAALRRAAEEVHERLADARLDQLPRLAVHGDFGPHQVLVDQALDDATVIDWDFTHVDTALADLAVGTSLARPTLDRAAAMIAGYLSTAPADPGDLELLGDLRRSFHLNNLANQVCALWVHGIDIAGSLHTIAGRLERERWWGPTLAEAARVARRPAGVAVGAPSRLARPDDGDLEIALALAERAAVVAMHHFERGVVAERKADDSPVTEADGAVELLLREGFGELRPDDAILGEEMGSSGPADARRTWILDPIDGTRAFAGGDADWRVQIALRDADEITVAVVAAPALGVRWFATAGGGAFEQDLGGRSEPRPLQVSTRSMPSATVACHPESIADRLPDELRRRDLGWGLELIDLIRGRLDAYAVECCEVWDHAPWVLLVIEAGGAFTDHRGGRSPEHRGGLYSNAAVHADLLGILDMA